MRDVLWPTAMPTSKPTCEQVDEFGLPIVYTSEEEATGALLARVDTLTFANNVSLAGIRAVQSEARSSSDALASVNSQSPNFGKNSFWGSEK